VSPRPRRPPEKSRGERARRRPYDVESLLEVAVQVFNEQGYEATSMEDLSRRLGITKSAIYHHVESKEQLLRMALDRALEGLFALLARVRSEQAPAIVRLEALVRGSVALLVDRLPYVTLLLRVRGNTALEHHALERRRAFDRAVAELVKQAEADGDIRPDVDPALTARLVFGMVNSIVEWYRPSERRDRDEIVDAVARLAFEGLRAERP
jgi:AcrR family transcriptional regulator